MNNSLLTSCLLSLSESISDSGCGRSRHSLEEGAQAETADVVGSHAAHKRVGALHPCSTYRLGIMQAYNDAHMRLINALEPCVHVTLRHV